jgi:oligoendopeptidase F
MAKALPKRSAVAKSDTWDLEALYPNVKAWEAAFAKVDKELARFAEFKGALGSTAGTLLRAMKTYDDIAPRVAHVYTWAALDSDTDTADQVAGARAGRAAGLFARFAEAVSFFQPELLAIDGATLARFADEKPALKLYAQHFDNIQRMRPHVRTAEIEALLAQGREALASPERAHGMLVDADMRFANAVDGAGRTVKLGRGNYGGTQTSPDRALRRSAWNSYNDAFLAVKNTLAEIMAAKVKSTVFKARARGYPDSLTSSLHPNAIPNAVYHNVIDACNRNIGIWHRYWEAKRKLLGVRKMEGFDVFAGVGKPVNVPYSTAVDYLCEGLAPLGADYVREVRKGLTTDRWVDWRPNIGKRNGAYSGGLYGTRPYILMSYQEQGLNGMSTLAHEVGHSMHTLLSCRTQPYIYADYGLFVAEVASNFDQALVRAHLIDSPRAKRDRNFQIAVIEEAMYNFHRYFFVMPILSQFEHWMHTQVEQGGSLTADAMTEHLAGLFERGYGPAWKLDRQREGIAWAQFSHFYADFYVYQYASGIAAANALAAGVVADKSGAAAKRYLEALSAGSSMYPLDTLKHAGIDMTRPEPMDRAFEVLDGFVKRLEALAA